MKQKPLILKEFRFCHTKTIKLQREIGKVGGYPGAGYILMMSNNIKAV